MKPAQRVFLDANVLVAIGFRPHGEYRRVLDAGGYVFVTSEHIFREVRENLIDLGREPDAFIQQLRAHMEVTDQVTKLPAGLPLKDDEDRQALAEAIGAKCDEFVTFNSRDFSALYGQTIFGVYIRHSAEFLRICLARES